MLTSFISSLATENAERLGRALIMAARKKEVVRELRRTKPPMSETADRYELYEAAVQNVAEQCAFIDHIFKQIRGRKAMSFREDFCGTASAACEWVCLGRSHFAFGVDLDPVVLDWGRKHRVSKLTKRQRQRITLLQSDVVQVKAPLVDVIGAFNFSYWIFNKRAQLRRYFKSAYQNLNPDGMFFLDAYGGYGAFMAIREKMNFADFTYIWDQARYNPITGQMTTHIHFKFPDGSKLQKAFSYEWRLWTLPELREILQEAGFRTVTVYFEYEDDDGEGLGEWYAATDRDADAAWVTNITAEK